MIFIYTTLPDMRAAVKMAKSVIDAKLAGCVNMWPVRSLYVWNLTLHDEKEVIVLMKTIPSKVKRLKEFVAKRHPYRVPCIATMKVSSINASYKQWLISCLKQHGH